LSARDSRSSSIRNKLDSRRTTASTQPKSGRTSQTSILEDKHQSSYSKLRPIQEKGHQNESLYPQSFSDLLGMFSTNFS
jgi:hypothetical protein